MEGDSLGIIYGVTSWVYPGLLKIGKAKVVQKRMREFNNSCPYRSYRLQFAFRFPDYDTAERLAHNRLRGVRIENTEWFNIHPLDAKQLVGGIPEAEEVCIAYRPKRSGFGGLGGPVEGQLRHRMSAGPERD